MKKFLLTGFALVSMASQAQTWVPQATKLPTSFAPREIAIVNANVVWTTVSDGRPLSQGGGTYPKTFTKTIDGGTTWTPGNITGAPAAALVGDIAAFDANTAWVVTAPSDGGTVGNGVYKTANGGTSWTKQNVFSASSFGNIVYFWDANTGITAGDPVGGKFEIFRTTNGGTAWSAVVTAPSPSSSTEYGLTGVRYAIGDNLWFGTTKGRIVRTQDKGLTWNIYYSPALDFGSGDATAGTVGSSASMAFKDSNNGLLITVDGEVTGQTPTVSLYPTTDGGQTWSPNPIIPNGPMYYGDITYVKGTPNTYVSTGNTTADATKTGSSYSTDGGLNWIAIDNGQQRGTVQFLNSTTGWCGDFADAAQTKGIFKFSGNLALATNENAVKSTLKVFPNPAVDVVNVSSKEEIKSVSIMDLSGKRVKAVQTKGEVNVSSLTKGTYILQVLYTNGSVENTKLIKK